MSKMLSLYSELDKNIYAEQPTGYVSQTQSGIVLNKDVYGLKQVSRACLSRLVLWYVNDNDCESSLTNTTKVWDR
jgi:hypothetical protein